MFSLDVGAHGWLGSWFGTMLFVRRFGGSPNEQRPAAIVQPLRRFAASSPVVLIVVEVEAHNS